MRLLFLTVCALAWSAPPAGEFVFTDVTDAAGLAEPLAGLTEIP